MDDLAELYHSQLQHRVERKSRDRVERESVCKNSSIGSW